MSIKRNWLVVMTSFVCSWNFYKFLHCLKHLIWPSCECQDVHRHTASKHAHRCSNEEQSPWKTNLIKIASPFSAIDLKRGSLLFFSTGSERRKETFFFFFCTFRYATPLYATLCVRSTSTENCIFRSGNTLLPHSYWAGQLLRQPQENNKQGVPSLWTPPNKTARLTMLKTRQPHVHDRPYQDHLRWTDQTLTSSTLLISETSNPLNT